MQSNADQVAESGAAAQGRLDRNTMIKSIIERRKKVQRAADTAWPHTNPANRKTRQVFRLPLNRPYSY